VLLVRRLEDLHRSFEIVPDYLKDVTSALAEPNFCDLGMQLTRVARALKVWVSIRYFGLDAFRSAVENSLALADRARRRIEASLDLELLAPVSLGIVCFRRVVAGADERTLDAINAKLIADVAAAGEAFISSTRVRGRLALRIAVVNHSTTQTHVDRLLDVLETAPVDAQHVPADVDKYDISPDAGASYVRGGTFDDVDLGSLAVFAGVTGPELELIEWIGVERRLRSGDALIEQWDTTRELLIILEGTVEIRFDGVVTSRLGAGDFVGEIAALEWHAGFSYPRTAAVIATSGVRLLVVPDGMAPGLARAVPVLGERLRLAAKERLERI
jgi:hypothetical protein